MWTKELIDGYVCCIKHFEEGSDYGILGGRISRLDIRKDGKILVNYDRGWDLKPQDKETIAVFKKVLAKYN